ncbi:hypothetical protein [Pseudoalteromonas sp.]|uniref:hypothetical protein n=1 Tax=Pseudoalteromonas sp. TaxID=53249 RepID=UPI003569C822
MSSISGIFDPMDFTGVQSRAAAEKVAKANEKAAETQRVAVDRARGELFELFPESQRISQEGFQGSLDVLGQSLPAQTDVFQQGNVGAQQAILSGLPQIQNALLGGNVDFSQMQPFQVQSPDLSFFQQTLPQIQQRQAQEAEAAAQQAQQNQFTGNAQQMPASARNIFGRNVNPGSGFNASDFLSGRFNQIP